MTYIINNPNEAQRLLCESWQAAGLDVVAIQNDKTIIVTDIVLEDEFRPFGAFIEEKTTEQIIEELYTSRSINQTVALF